MKLRFRGNSLRVRVSQTELERLADAGFAEDRVRFSPTAYLTYRLEVRPQGAVCAAFSGGEVRVGLPQALFERWLGPEEVSISAEQELEAGEKLKILVEKDFACLAPREDEDQSDLFPNPAEGGVC